jgi:quinol monooxygenase YgiN
MPVVVARVYPKPGHAQEVLTAYGTQAPLFHREPGCELFAVNEGDGNIIIVEKWTADADLRTHIAGANFATLHTLIDDLLVTPSDIWPVRPVPFGDPLKGVVRGFNESKGSN